MVHVRDFVLPLANIRFDITDPRKTLSFDAIGSCCLIGGRGYALTAAHVVDQLDQNAASAAFVIDGKWHHSRIVQSEKHPSEDIAVVQFATSELTSRRSFFAVTGKFENASLTFELWGYPKHVTKEIELEQPAGDAPLARPELIFFRGYVRRRIPRQLPISIYRGSMFYELSVVAGEAVSGAPIVVRRKGDVWDITGLYVGENTSLPAFAVGYAATADCFANWRPILLARTISEEAGTTARP